MANIMGLDKQKGCDRTESSPECWHNILPLNPPPRLREFKNALLCPYASFHHKLFTNQQPRTLHRAGIYQIELVKKTCKNAGNFMWGLQFLQWQGTRAWWRWEGLLGEGSFLKWDLKKSRNYLKIGHLWHHRRLKCRKCGKCP